MQKNKLDNLKIAVVHDLLVEYGGAEEVFFNILELFPRADVFTSLVDPIGWMYKKVKQNLKKSFINWKYIHTFESLLKLPVFVYWDNLDLSEYDLVISSSGSFSSKAVITLPSTLSVCYCHTPPKYLYNEFSETDDGFLSKRFKNLFTSFLRPADFVASQRPDVIVVNSKEVAGRVKKYYKRDSFIVYPPVAVSSELPVNRRLGSYYVYVGRLYRQKGLDLLVDAFNKNGKRLIIVGEGSRSDYLKNKANHNIEFKGFVDNEEKIEILKRARGFVFAGLDEDFGIAPVEALGYGIPVIAYKSGGLKETVIEGRNGVFFNEYTADAFNSALKRFETMKFDKKLCWITARKFSKQNFKKNFLQIINSHLKK